MVLEDSGGDLWKNDPATGDTTKVGDLVAEALNEAGADLSEASGPLGAMLGSLEDGTLTEEQIAAILRD